MIGLKDGTPVTLREPTKDDVERYMRFFGTLPEDDRLYLRYDVTKREVVERRLDAPSVHRVVALVDDEIVADGALELSLEGWRSHLGEIRVIVARSYRRRHLGALLIRHLFHVAQQRRVGKVLAKMAAPQIAARKVFERLGFHVDAELSDFVKDARGKLHPLVVMSCTLNEMWEELRDFYRDDNWPDG
jgi:ribosomal protein S18 acetylase RimI-like enzyme